VEVDYPEVEDDDDPEVEGTDDHPMDPPELAGNVVHGWEEPHCLPQLPELDPQDGTMLLIILEDEQTLGLDIGLDTGLDMGLELPQPPLDVGLPDSPHGDGRGL